MSDNHGKVWWTELMTRDPARAKGFYADICGWSFDEMPMENGTYHVGKVGDQMVIGIFDISAMEGMEQMPPHWLSYLAVDDVDRAVEQTRDAGGQIHREPFDVAGVGRIAIIADPTGAAIGLMTPSEGEMAAA